MKTKNTQDLMDVNCKIDGDAIDKLFDNNNSVEPKLFIKRTTLNIHTHNNSNNELLKTLILTGDTEHFETVFDDIKNTHFSHFDSYDEVRVPNKIRAAISRDCDKRLKEIHPDIEVAKELVLIIASNFNNTWLLSKDARNERQEKGYKQLYHKILRSQVSIQGKTSDNTYKKIINFLIEGTKKGPIIEKGRGHSSFFHTSTEYKLTENYFGKGNEVVKLKTVYAKKLVKKYFFSKMHSLTSNKIGRLLLMFYSVIETPEEDKVIEKLDKLIEEGYSNKRGKKLIWAKTHRKKLEATKKYVFAEDYLKLFHELTDKFLIPIIGGENSGGRVVDSFTLMPSVLRVLFTIDGEPIEIPDYSALHPNIAVKIFDGDTKYITHKKIATELGIEENEVKIENLSFFNKSFGGEITNKDGKNVYISGMIYSPIYKFYEKNDQKMILNIKNNKEKNGYKETSKLLLTKEVEIMETVMERLFNEFGIITGYVYDALICSKENRNTVVKVMNEEILKFGVYTQAK